MELNRVGWEYVSSAPYMATITRPAGTTPCDCATMVIALNTCSQAIANDRSVLTVMIVDALNSVIYGFDRGTGTALGTRESTDLLISLVDIVEDMEASITTLELVDAMRLDALNNPPGDDDE